MALIAMAIYCTEENQKEHELLNVLDQLRRTVDFGRHRVFLVVNGTTPRASRIIQQFLGLGPVRTYLISNEENLGTARAINKAWAFREPGELCVKMDDDIEILTPGWADEMEAVVAADPTVGQVGLKRKDCWETPWHDNRDYKSRLVMLPHQPGERWHVVEEVKHVIGSCVGHSAALLGKVGYLYQPGLYGYDDVLMSHRAHLAGFTSCFIPHVEINHVDAGLTPYQGWKEKTSGQVTQEVIKLVHEMYAGTKPIYYAQY